MAEKPTVILIGPTPPPYHGVSVATRLILTSGLAGSFRLVHLDTADRRGIQHVDKPDLYDLFLFMKQFFKNVVFLLLKRPALFYIPVSQTRIGFFRDSLFILPALMAGCPVVVHLHGAAFDRLYEQSGPIWRAYAGVILRRVARFIVLGEMLKPIFRRWVADERISVVPNGIPSAGPVGGPTVGKKPVEKRPFRVLFLSTLSRQKGLFVLLDAAAQVLREEKEVEFHIAGSWYGDKTGSDVAAWLDRTGLQQNVRFVGAVTGEEKGSFLRSGDLFVFPGIQQEGQPLTVLEAMSEGLPVIATDRGCLRETVLDGVTGLIVSPNAPEAIAEKIVALIRDPHLRERMAAAGRKRFEAHYTQDRFVRRLEKVLIETLNSASGYKRSVDFKEEA